MTKILISAIALAFCIALGLDLSNETAQALDVPVTVSN